MLPHDQIIVSFYAIRLYHYNRYRYKLYNRISYFDKNIYSLCLPITTRNASDAVCRRAFVQYFIKHGRSLQRRLGDDWIL
ncbi:hypothetical protein VTL71DRAFT_15528 [Oculimacula yallundae]|uniref:Uncharacterized protein n=1 Tax=Oculimacula yallundae TaxID=86028 RepID=A0ABR4CHG5_9HELO